MVLYLIETTAAAQPGASGFDLAIALLVIMGVVLIYTIVRLIRGFQGHTPGPRPAWLEFATPVLVVVGLGVAGYLTYVEVLHVSPVCGPIGNCDLVQNSSYSKMFGVLPVGVVGLMGYTAILAAWLWGRLRSDKLAGYMPLIIFGLTLFGTLYSMYLTYLEPFVIMAVCMWCLSSAAIMTLLMLLNVNPALRGIAVMEEDEGD